MPGNLLQSDAHPPDASDTACGSRCFGEGLGAAVAAALFLNIVGVDQALRPGPDSAYWLALTP